MTTDANTNATASPVDLAVKALKIEAFRSTIKDHKSYLARITLDTGVTLPVFLEGDTAEAARTAAVDFFKADVFNRVFDFSHVGDSALTNKSILSLFAQRPATGNKSKKTTKTEDQRHAFKGLKWYVNDQDKPIRIADGEIEHYEKYGYLPGKKWATAVAKYEGTDRASKKSDPNYVNPIRGKILMHKSGEKNIRVEEDQVADLIKNGWTKGRPPKAYVSTAAAPDKAAEQVSDAGATTPSANENASQQPANEHVEVTTTDNGNVSETATA